MRIHLCQGMDDCSEETFKILFNSFASSLTALDRHFGDPDMKHTVAVTLDKLRQANHEFGVYLADFQELMDILKTTDDTFPHYTLKNGLNYTMLSALAIYTTAKDKSFDKYIECLNELDYCLRALATHTCNQHRLQMPRTPIPNSTSIATGITTVTANGTATSIATGPMDLSAARKKQTPAKRQYCQTQDLCMYCGGVGHFAVECQAQYTGTAGMLDHCALAGTWVTMMPVSNSDSELGKEETLK